MKRRDFCKKKDEFTEKKPHPEKLLKKAVKGCERPRADVIKGADLRCGK